jgi:DNA-binding transcriptional LysR family regulator
MGDIETRLFRYFVALAEEQHFARAALRLRITPPTLTHQIKKLESELGARLVERKGNTNVLLTPAGARFFVHAQQVLRQVEEARTVAQRAERGEVGCIEIGYMPSASCSGLLQKWLAEFQRTNPAIEINLHRLVPMAQITAIIRKDLDVAFTRSPHKYPAGLEGFEVYRQPMVLALPSKHPLAHRKTISPATLKDEMFVNTGPELDVGFWGHTEVVAGAGNFTPRVVKRDDDLITILTYVAMGYGIGVVPESMARISIPNVVYRQLATNAVLTSSIAFVHRRNDSSPSADLLIEYMKGHALPHL